MLAVSSNKPGCELVRNSNTHNEMICEGVSVPVSELERLREQLEREKDDAIVQ